MTDDAAGSGPVPGIAGRLLARIDARGWRGSLVPIHRLADLREAIEGPHHRGEFDEGLFDSQLDFLSFEPPADLPEARSILVVAVPTPQMRVFFHRHGARFPVVIPPTYVSFTPRAEAVRAELAGWLGESGHRVAEPRLPLKTLAVRSGLAEWGRNNVTYVAGFGSFLQLVGAYSDLPARHDPWREPTALHRCARCRACVRRCPTGAIDPERFLLRAERCLTYHNEAAADYPDWIDPGWHHCLVGCMRCQTICPENQEMAWRYEDRAVDPKTPIANAGTVEQTLDAQTKNLRLSLLLLGVFGVVAAVLAAVGIYGVMAHSVTERTREFGVRMALGARASDVLLMVIRRAATLIAIGVALGLTGAVAFSGVLDSTLFGITATDPLTYAAVSAVLLVVAALACVVPAGRAAALNPIAALRQD